ncbi:MAG: hypothetical protein WCD42_08575 [Rhizomicrobium sp.]
MLAARDRLKRFLTLADQGPAQRAALAVDLVDFLVDWPAECPLAMRPPVLALLDMTLQEADGILRKRLAARLATLDDLPLGLANEIFHCAPDGLRQVLLRRNEDEGGRVQPLAAYDPLMLLGTVRDADRDSLAHRLVGAMHVPLSTAVGILGDESGLSLAVLCKGTRLGRAFYSALAVLAFQGLPGGLIRLGAYDRVSQRAADNLTACWQLQNRQSPPGSGERIRAA